MFIFPTTDFFPFILGVFDNSIVSSNENICIVLYYQNHFALVRAAMINKHAYYSRRFCLRQLHMLT